MKNKNQQQPSEEQAFEEKLKRVSSKSLDTMEKVLDGDLSIDDSQTRTASVALSARFKHESSVNGRARNMISLIRLGVRDLDVREVVAQQVLHSLGVKVPELASGEVVHKADKALEG